MKYTVSRNGEPLGTHSIEELRTLAQQGRVLGTDLATAEGAMQSTSVAQLIAPPAAAAGGGYLVRRGNDQFGPYPTEQFLQYARAGNFAPADVTWCPGMAAWEPVPAVLARFGVNVPASPPPAGESTSESLKWVLPVGRSGLAIAAGYLGLFSVLFIFAPIALVVGILAVRDIKKNPGKGGIGRAWFGVIMGAIFSAFLALGVIAQLAR